MIPYGKQNSIAIFQPGEQVVVPAGAHAYPGLKGPPGTGKSAWVRYQGCCGGSRHR